jgi:hypothetical protein
MGANASTTQVNPLAGSPLTDDGPLQRFYVSFNTAAKPTGRAQQKHAAGSREFFFGSDPTLV